MFFKLLYKLSTNSNNKFLKIIPYKFILHDFLLKQNFKINLSYLFINE